jgi:hypothetical protein
MAEALDGLETGRDGGDPAAEHFQEETAESTIDGAVLRHEHTHPLEPGRPYMLNLFHC